MSKLDGLVVVAGSGLAVVVIIYDCVYSVYAMAIVQVWAVGWCGQ